MKSLFIYYSFTGNGDVVADNLKEKGVDIRQVVRKKKLPKSFFFGVMTGGFLAGINHKDKLVDFDSNIDGYDRIIIGSPIWNGRFSSPINTVLSFLDLKGKEVEFLFCSGSGEGNKAVKRINKQYSGSKITFLKEPKKHLDELKKLDAIQK